MKIDTTDSSLLEQNRPQNTTGEWISITVIDDKRCVDCGTESIVSQLEKVPFLEKATFKNKDFSDEWVEDYLKKNEITVLPAVIFNTNSLSDNGTMVPYLSSISDDEYSLQIGAIFNPFEKRSEKGFLIINKDDLKNIKKGAYTQWQTNAKITWIEYSDIECPFCAKLHNSGVIEEVTKKYGSDLQLMFQHFPLNFHPNAEPAAMVLECLAAEKWASDFYSLIKIAFTSEKSDKDYLIEEAVKLWANKWELESCVEEERFKQKINNQLVTGQTMFGITGTPGNVLINNETGEYDIIPGAYGVDRFSDTIDRLLK